MTPAPQGSEPWMPNGFPPPSFVVETERAGAMGARGRWLAAAAILGALLLIAGVLLIARNDDGKTTLTAGTSTTAFGDTTPTTPTTALDPTASLPPANTTPVDPGTSIAGATTTTTAAGGTATTAAPPAATGVLAVASTLAIPKVNSAIGPGTAQMALKNNGRAALSFNSQTNFSGLTVAPATGSIAAGAEVVVTVSLNGAAAAEGPFSGIVSFGGTGGTQRVTVTSTVARLPVLSENLDAVRQCPEVTPTCSKLIDTLAEGAGANPCNNDWVYKLNVSDESGLKSVTALSGTNVPLKTGAAPGATSGPSGIWQSDRQTKLPAGTHTFTIEAIDTFDNSSKTLEHKITCPAA